MIRRFAIALILAAVASGALLAQASTLTGEWSVTYRPPAGEVTFSMFLTQSGTRLTGSMETEGGEFPITGSVDGNKFTLTFTRPSNGAMVKFTFTGTFSGDTLTGTATLNADGPYPLNGERS
jgi:hypothetical protein